MKLGIVTKPKEHIIIKVYNSDKLKNKKYGKTIQS